MKSLLFVIDCAYGSYQQAPYWSQSLRLGEITVKYAKFFFEFSAFASSSCCFLMLQMKSERGPSYFHIIVVTETMGPIRFFKWQAQYSPFHIRLGVLDLFVIEFYSIP